MFVCLCKPTKETDIKKAIDAGADTIGKVKKITGACQDCCGCKELLEITYERLKKCDT